MDDLRPDRIMNIGGGCFSAKVLLSAVGLGLFTALGDRAMTANAIAERFELIECSGVLHHLADPAAGLAVLRGLLAPGGVMKLGLYARRGRRAIQAARDFAAGLGEPMTPAGLRRVRQALLALPAAHPAAPRAVRRPRGWLPG